MNFLARVSRNFQLSPRYLFSLRKDKLMDSEKEKRRLKGEITLNAGRFEENGFIYYLDRWDRIRRVDTTKAPPEDKIRLKFLEYPYRWWINKTPDVQNALIPFFLCFLIGGVIYNLGNFFIEREDSILDKAKVPAEINQQTYEQWLKEKKQREQ